MYLYHFVSPQDKIYDEEPLRTLPPRKAFPPKSGSEEGAISRSKPRLNLEPPERLILMDVKTEAFF